MLNEGVWPRKVRDALKRTEVKNINDKRLGAERCQSVGSLRKPSGAANVPAIFDKQTNQDLPNGTRGAGNEDPWT